MVGLFLSSAFPFLYLLCFQANDYTALIWAAHGGHLEMVVALIKEGAAVNHAGKVSW